MFLVRNRGIVGSQKPAVTGPGRLAFDVLGTSDDVGLRVLRTSAFDSLGTSDAAVRTALRHLTAADSLGTSDAAAIPAAVLPTTGLFGRLRGDSIALADGAAVSVWPALVGGDTSGGAGAVFAATGINSKPAVRFIANSHWLKWGSVSSGINPVSMLVVCRYTALSTMYPLGTTDASTGGFYVAFDGSGNVVFRKSPGSTVFQNSSAILPASGTVALLLTYDSANNANDKIYLNGVSQSVNVVGGGSTPSAGARTDIGVDQWEGSPGFFNGWIAEVAKWDHVLNSTERTQLFAYTLARYGV